MSEATLYILVSRIGIKRWHGWEDLSPALQADDQKPDGCVA